MSNTFVNRAGFTLIELTVVTAISGLLIVIAFAGQRQLRDRARFDADINKIVSDINYTRNYAMSNVNETGQGQDTQDLYVGAGIEFDDSHLSGTPSYPLAELEPLYAGVSGGQPDWNSLSNWPPNATLADCPNSLHPDEPGMGDACQETFFSLQTDITLSGMGKANLYFVRNSTGIRVCSDLNYQYATIGAACAVPAGGPPIQLLFKDSQGFQSTIQIDTGSGLAARLN